jgi:phage gp46-like protein
MAFDIEIEIEQGTGRGSMTFEKSETIMNKIWLRLMIPKGSFFQNPDLGSRLHLLKKSTRNIESLARDYCYEALKPLIGKGDASGIDITVEHDARNRHRLNIQVIVKQGDGRQVPFTIFKEVV